VRPSSTSGSARAWVRMSRRATHLRGGGSLCYDGWMRRPLVLALLSLLLASGDASAQGVPSPLQSRDRPALKVLIDRSKVDLVHHTLEVKLSRAAEKVRLKVVGESGALLAEVEKDWNGARPGTPLAMSWTPASDEAVAKIEVWGHDTDGYYAGVAIVPWSVKVPHQEVNFATNSDVIQSGDVPKLEASSKLIAEIAGKHAELGKVTLYVLGHTDTVGSQEHNLNLSRKRARAIAAWFRGHGLRIAIAFEGLGERAPLVKTADEVDEPQNRRVDYILALDPPTLPGGEFSWKSP
jgi:outer membrane protein OmpA-like peptidoglycan-associated protein